MIRRFQFPLMICLMLFGISKSYSSAVYHYTVNIPKQLDHFSVELCFSSAPPAYLYLPDPDTESHFMNIQLIQENKKIMLKASNRYLDLKAAQQGDCLSYEAMFSGKVTHPWFKQRQSRQDQILVSLNQWLLPPPGKSKTTAIIDFHLPSGYDVSSPGKLIRTTSNTQVYRFRPRPTNWQGRIAVGRFVKTIKKKGFANIEIAILGGRKKFDQQKISKWIDRNLTTLRQIYGQLPVRNLQIMVVPVGADREPVPWGQVMRGGGDAVHLYIDETRPLNEFIADWVLIHELGHLLHPRISGNGNWLSEGMASYYQHVLRARSGLLTEKQAWDKLNAGFERGIRGTSPNRTLAQITETMMRDRSFMRVYWSGAAISFLADVRLRESLHNKQSLDTVLQKFKQCCLPVDKDWSAFELMGKFDQLSETTIFTELYDQYVDSTQFPALNNTYKKLGLKSTNSQLTILPDASEIQIRRNIMQAIIVK